MAGLVCTRSAFDRRLPTPTSSRHPSHKHLFLEQQKRLISAPWNQGFTARIQTVALRYYFAHSRAFSPEGMAQTKLIEAAEWSEDYHGRKVE
jgi:hypothetical protein